MDRLNEMYDMRKRHKHDEEEGQSSMEVFNTEKMISECNSLREENVSRAYLSKQRIDRLPSMIVRFKSTRNHRDF